MKQIALQKGVLKQVMKVTQGRGESLRTARFSSQAMGRIKGKRVKFIILNALSPINARVLNLFEKIR